MKKWVIRVIALVLFIVFLALVITGQRTVGVPYLIRMLIGTLGILAMLFWYNRQHQ